MDLLSVSARGTARAGEHQLANVIAGRVTDRLLATGYAGLAAR